MQARLCARAACANAPRRNGLAAGSFARGLPGPTPTSPPTPRPILETDTILEQNGIEMKWAHAARHAPAATRSFASFYALSIPLFFHRSSRTVMGNAHGAWQTDRVSALPFRISKSPRVISFWRPSLSCWAHSGARPGCRKRKRLVADPLYPIAPRGLRVCLLDATASSIQGSSGPPTAERDSLRDTSVGKPNIFFSIFGVCFRKRVELKK